MYDDPWLYRPPSNLAVAPKALPDLGQIEVRDVPRRPGEQTPAWVRRTAMGLRAAAALGLGYYGYRRHQRSLLWAAGWAVFGFVDPVVAGVTAAVSCVVRS